MEEKKNREEKGETYLKKENIFFCGQEEKRRRKGEIILRRKMSFFGGEGKAGK